MLDSTSTTTSADGKTLPETLDALIIGAGVAGLYQLHQLREQGLKVRAVDAAGNVGGTWYWNRYPGAVRLRGLHLSVPVLGGALQGLELERALPRPARDRALAELRRRPARPAGRTSSSTPPSSSADYNEATERWTVTTDTGETIDTQFLITCCGMLSAPLTELFPGQDSFKGQIFHTARWPRERSTWPASASAWSASAPPASRSSRPSPTRSGELKVFVRTPQYVLPMKNPNYGPARGRGLQGPLRGAEGDDPAHLHRLRVRLRAHLGRPDAGAAPRGARGHLRRRLAQAVARLVRRDVLRRAGQRGGLGVRAREDARAAQGPASCAIC